MPAPEALARVEIDRALNLAGWVVHDVDAINLQAGRGIAVREFPLATGHGFADYLLYADGQAVGVIEAKKQGSTLTSVELQSEKYGAGLPSGVPAPIRPLPLLYQSTGVETRFTNRLDPTPKSREIFAFHQPAALAGWVAADPLWLPQLDGRPQPASQRPANFRTRLTAMPSVDERGLWPAQLGAVRSLETSFAANRPRALIQMATGSGKTFTAVTSIYRLLKFAGAKKVLFLVDRANLGRQALKEFQSYRAPDDGRLFTELYNVQLLSSNHVDPVANVVIGTVQRLYSILKGEPELAPDADELSAGGLDALRKEPLPVVYNPALPLELFDVVFIDEAHRSIYTLWRQVVEYWDAFLVGLTATPSKQTYGFFHGNLVAEYGHEAAVADGVNVDFDVYRIRTKITEQGSSVDAGAWVDRRDRETRARRWERLDEDLSYDSAALDRSVVAPDQIRTVVRAFRDRFLKEVFPERKHIPKTLIFAKDDSHAEDIVKIIRDELALGNDAVQKITYRTGTARISERALDAEGREIERITYKSSGVRPEDLLQSFRNSFNPRIAVTVDMIATGTDVKPLEILWFMRSVKSRTLFEQMKGRGVRVIGADDLKGATPDASAKTRFVIVDCVGVCEEDLSDSRPLEKQPTVSLEKLLQAVAMGNTEPDVASSVASRLTRLDSQLGREERLTVADAAGGQSLRSIAGQIVHALDPDATSDEQRHAAIREALVPIATRPDLRRVLIDLKRSKEQTIDAVSVDELLESGLSKEARDRAASLATSFEQFLAAHRDEFVALRLLYGSPTGRRITREALEELRVKLLEQRPPLATDEVWRAYELLDRPHVRGAAAKVLTDMVSLVRFASHQRDELAPWTQIGRARYEKWLGECETSGRRFNPDEREWLDLIAEYLAANVEMTKDDFEYPPFVMRGGLGGAYKIFGERLMAIVDEVAGVVAA